MTEVTEGSGDSSVTEGSVGRSVTEVTEGSGVMSLIGRQSDNSRPSLLSLESIEDSSSKVSRSIMTVSYYELVCCQIYIQS